MAVRWRSICKNVAVAHADTTLTVCPGLPPVTKVLRRVKIRGTKEGWWLVVPVLRHRKKAR